MIKTKTKLRRELLRGVTLLELIVVIAIIGVLATAMFAYTMKGKSDAQDSKAWEAMNAINAIAYKCVVINKCNLNVTSNVPVVNMTICTNAGAANCNNVDTTSTWPSLPPNSGYSYYKASSTAGTGYGYAISASLGGSGKDDQGNSGSGGSQYYRIATCGFGMDFTNSPYSWYGLGISGLWNFTGSPGCKKYGM